MVSSLGAPFEHPLGHLKEYLKILRGLFKNGEIDFEGRHYTARTSIAEPVDLPVMASALRPRSFEVCGEMSDGAISWLCPARYIEEIALPALRSGAAQAGNDVPPLVMHVPVAVHGDRDEVYAAFAEQASFYLQAPFYAAMFERAGFSAVGQSGWTREMLDAVVVTGSEEEVADKINGFLDLGNAEVLGMVITGASRGGSSAPLPLEGAPADRTVALLAELSAR